MAERSHPLNWGEKRKLIIEIVLSIVGIVVVGGVLFVVFYRAPSCTDGKQDGTETGIDCGISCPYACASQENAPKINFVRALSPQPGRTDIIAYVSNTNSNAGAEAASYTLELFGKNGSVLAEKTGTITLPPDSTVPLFIPNFYDGSEVVGRPVITFATSSIQWLKNVSQPVLPTPSNIQIQDGQTTSGIIASPRVTATLTNPTSFPIYGQTVVVTVFNAQNTAIAASQTVVPELAPEGTAPVVFTWNESFSTKAVRAEILPSFGS